MSVGHLEQIFITNSPRTQLGPPILMGSCFVDKVSLGHSPLVTYIASWLPFSHSEQNGSCKEEPHSPEKPELSTLWLHRKSLATSDLDICWLNSKGSIHLKMCAPFELFRKTSPLVISSQLPALGTKIKSSCGGRWVVWEWTDPPLQPG